MLIVIALGGNALLRRGDAASDATQRANVERAAHALAPFARDHRLVITHGNGSRCARAPRRATAPAPASTSSARRRRG